MEIVISPRAYLNKTKIRCVHESAFAIRYSVFYFYAKK